MITDARSEKVGQVAENPFAEIAWYLVVRAPNPNLFRFSPNFSHQLTQR
jgi:hypothetical protein